jgi:hypothetical protein
MNPFEVGIVSANGFHAVMTQTIARKRSRRVQEKDRQYFYNPMWGRMGDSSGGPPGTYYYTGSYISYFWNTFDQVLLRPDLLDFFSPNDLRVVSQIGDKNLLMDNGIHKNSFSDHLPIIVTLQIERMTQNAQ